MLNEKKRKAGRKGGIISTSLHPRSREYLSQSGKLGGRPRRKNIDELMKENKQGKR